MQFEHPAWLLLVVLSLPMAFTAVRWFSSMSLVRRWSAAVLRVVLIGLIAGMLAGATAVRTTEKLAVIAVIDVSGSVRRFATEAVKTGGDPGVEMVRDRILGFLRETTKQRRPDDLLGVVVFDGEAAAVAAPTRVDVLDQIPDLTMVEGTDIERAIRLGAAMAPPDASARVVVFSDGVETEGDAVRAAEDVASISRGGAAGREGADAAAARDSIPIDVVPLAYNVTREVFVESVDAPPVAPDGSVVTVRVVLETAGESRGQLELLREGQPLDINGDAPGTGRALTLSSGRHEELVSVRLPRGRMHRFEAVYVPDSSGEAGSEGAGAGSGVLDTIALNNRAEAFTFTPGTGSVLIVSGVGDAASSVSVGGQTAADALPETLREAGFGVTVITPDAMPGDPLPLQAYDLVVLANVPADAMPKRTQEMLAGYVKEQGGGLVMIGGRNSFGAGGWKGTEIEGILPVKLDLPEKLVVPAVAIVFVLDNSGSMGRRVMGSSRTQQYIANEGAAIAVRSLDKNDLVGVVTFNNRFDVLAPLAKNSEAERTAEVIRSIRSDGGTNIPPAVEEAGRQLRRVTADFKHVIVMTDGRSQGKESLPGIAEQLASEGIHVTTIGVGDDCDEPTLRLMANRGRGVFYPVTDPTTLPRIFVKAVRVVRSPMVRESPFEPIVLATGSAIVERLGAPLPPLGGISLTQARIDPLVTTAMVHPAGEPVLAHWNVGLGRVAAFTSDAAGWSRSWIPTPTYKQFWTDLTRLVSRPPSDRSQELTIETAGSDLHIRLDATGEGGKPLDLLSVPGSLYMPSGERVPIRLSQTGPGVYEATARAPTSGNHVVTLTPRLGSKSLAPIVGGVSRASGVEYRRLRSNIGLLEEIARLSGGRVHDLSNPAGVNLFDRANLKPTEARLPLWRTLLLWAVVVLLLDIGTRRIAWDRLVSREFGATLKSEAKAAMASRAKESERVLRELRTSEVRREERSKGAPQPEALTTDDARAIVRAEAERRRAARAAQRAEQAADLGAAESGRRGSASAGTVEGAAGSSERSGAATPADGGAGAREEQRGNGREGGGEEAAGGLFAAKKRARERMDRENEI